MTTLELLDALLARYGRVAITRAADVDGGCNRDHIVIGVAGGQQFEIDCPSRYNWPEVKRREILEIGLEELAKRSP